MPPANTAPRDRLIVALDLPSVGAAEAMIARLGDSVSFYKIGYQLAFAGGLPLVRQLTDAGKKVFADLKLHDISHTVPRRFEPANPRRHRADLLRRRRPPRRRLSARRVRPGRGPRPAGAGARGRWP